MSSSNELRRECQQVAERARSVRKRSFSYRIDGDEVTLEGEVLTPDGIDSLVRLFEATRARKVHNKLRHAPPDPERPGALDAGRGYVDVVNLGPHGARLVETLTWEVKAGDTLAAIARAVYGDPTRIEPILNANRDQLPPDGHVHAGMRLKLPAP